MATVTKNRNFFKWPKLLYFKPECAQIWTVGEDLNVIFYQNMPNLHNRYISAERKISQKNPEYMLKSSSLCLYSSNLGTFWLTIEQFWPFEEISIFSNSGHLGYRTACSYMARSSLAYVRGFCLKFFFQPIYTDYAN
jgi:hypothetical protein